MFAQRFDSKEVVQRKRRYGLESSRSVNSYEIKATGKMETFTLFIRSTLRANREMFEIFMIRKSGMLGIIMSIVKTRRCQATIT